jgi:hypothetical protein
MMIIRRVTTTLCLMAALIAALIPAPVSAADRTSDEAGPIRLHAIERFGPIGAIKMNSLSDPGVAIDGRIAQGEAPIWGGELIRVRNDRTVRVVLDSIGQVTLAQGAVVRFASARASSEDAGYQVLVASLIAGSVDVKLNATAGAYLEAGRSAITASRGARFSVGFADGRASIATVVGVVRVQDQPAPPQDVNIRLVDDLGRPVASGSQFSVRARSTRQVQVQVTDKNDKPIPDLPVLFSLGNPCLGTLGLGAVAGLTLLQKTDNRGIAAVPLVAGAAKCAASILAKVEGTNASLTIQTNVQSNTGFWSTQNTLLVVAGAAAAGVTAGVIVANSGGNEPITPVPPPGVRP